MKTTIGNAAGLWVPWRFRRCDERFFYGQTLGPGWRSSTRIGVTDRGPGERKTSEMNRSIRGVIMGAVSLPLIVLAGCENNEANVKGTGVTPPSAGKDAADFKVPPPKSATPVYGGKPAAGTTKKN